MTSTPPFHAHCKYYLLIYFSIFSALSLPLLLLAHPPWAPLFGLGFAAQACLMGLDPLYTSHLVLTVFVSRLQAC